MKFRVWFISVSFACFLSHFDSTERHKCTFQRFVSLKTHNLFFIFQFFADITWTVSGKRRYHFCFHIQNAAFCTFFFLEFLKLAPELVCCFGRVCKEWRISLVRCVVVLDKITNVDFFFPESSFKSLPLFFLHHLVIPPSCGWAIVPMTRLLYTVLLRFMPGKFWQIPDIWKGSARRTDGCLRLLYSPDLW